MRGWGADSRVGPYRLLRHIGTGGMAEVWLAERADGAFQRQVAIKLLFRHADSTQRDSFAQRFTRERDILASLHHPNIAALHDAGVTPTASPGSRSNTSRASRSRPGATARGSAWPNACGCSARCCSRSSMRMRTSSSTATSSPPTSSSRRRRGAAARLRHRQTEEEGGAPLAETELTRHAGRPLTVQYASPEQLSGARSRSRAMSIRSASCSTSCSAARSPTNSSSHRRRGSNRRSSKPSRAR